MSLWKCTLCVLLVGFGPMARGADSDDRPSAEMLKFLAEWESVDEETFDLLVEHGVRDANNETENSDDTE